jgi:hypothetical protein
MPNVKKLSAKSIKECFIVIVHYQDWEWDELKLQVDEAHQLVLKEYRVEDINKAIDNRGRELGL